MRNHVYTSLDDTVNDMLSKDYKCRMMAEYGQLLIRYDGLVTMLEDWKNGNLTFIPNAPRHVYEKQREVMESYLDILGKRIIHYDRIAMPIIDTGEVVD